MLAAADTTTAAALDPTALALLSIFGGAALAALAGLVGAWIQSRREHSKWVRDQRVAAYIRIVAHLSRMREAAVEISKLEAAKPVDAERLQRLRIAWTALQSDSSDTMAAAAILGPRVVFLTMADAIHALSEENLEQFSIERAKLVGAAREALKIPV